MIALLFGDRGLGKTCICERVVHLAQKRGRRLGGCLSRALFDEQGIKVGIRVLDLYSGVERVLAGPLGQFAGPSVGRFSMDGDALSWALGQMRAALDAGVDLLIVDEIGPLELFQGQGFAPVLEWLAAHPKQDALLVVRPELLDELHRRLSRAGLAPIFRYHAVPENRDALPEELVRLFWG